MVPVEGGILVDLNRMYRVLDVDTENRLALVEPGLINLDLSTEVAPLGFYYAPDPSSQKTSTIPAMTNKTFNISDSPDRYSLAPTMASPPLDGIGSASRSTGTGVLPGEKR